LKKKIIGLYSGKLGSPWLLLTTSDTSATKRH